MTTKWKPIAAAAAATLALNTTANADFDMFLEIPGIAGEIDDADFKGAIDVLAWSWGLSSSDTTHTGGGGGGVPANYQDLSATIYVDSSAVPLYSAIATNSLINAGPTKLSVREGGATFNTIEILMENVLVTSASTGGSGVGALTQNISLNFSKFTTKYKKDLATPAIEYCFDIVANKKC